MKKETESVNEKPAMLKKLEEENTRLKLDGNAKNTYIQVLEQKLANNALTMAKLETNVAIYKAKAEAQEKEMKKDG